MASPGSSVKIIGVVQARMGSSRFPAKMMAELGGRPLIDWVLHRVKASRLLDQVVLATSQDPANDVLAERAELAGVEVIRGDEQDVLGRFLVAAEAFQAEYVVRICADNPFVAPEEIDRLISSFLAEKPDYAFNHIPRMDNCYPDGLGAEMLSRSLLAQIGRRADHPRHREHVTIHIWENLPAYRICAPTAPEDIAHPRVKLDVDTREDLTRLNKLSCAQDLDCNAREIVRCYLEQFG